MFFRALGQVIRRAWPLVLAAWAVLIAVTWYFAPNWDAISQDQEFAFLPADSPSVQASAAYAKAFPDDRLSSTIVLVLTRPAGSKPDLDKDLKYIEDVIEPGLRKIADAEGGLAADPQPVDEDPNSDPFAEPAETTKPAKPAKRSDIARIRTPNAPGSGALLVSDDGRAMLVVLELTNDFLSRANWPTITRVEQFVADLQASGKVPAGLEIQLTGSAVIGRDQSEAQLQSARDTELLTVLLVVVLLVVIYRAPLLAIIPLLTVYLAVQLSLNLLGILAEAGYITLFNSLRIYITILTYGAGVDYCLFLTARYREELDKGAAPGDALAAAIRGVGAALVASAGTVMFGIGMMMFADFGKFREAGFAIPLSLFLVLCATLTFSASLLRMAGPWAFWPRRPGPAATRVGGGLIGKGLQWAWDEVGGLLSRRPGTIWLATVAVMLPFVVLAGILYNKVSYDMVGDLPADAPSVAGTRALTEHFPAGTVGTVSVLLINPQADFASAEGRKVVSELTGKLTRAKDELGLADVRSLSAPLGITAAALRANNLKDIHVDPAMAKEATEKAAVRRYTSSLGERNYIATRLDLTLVQSPFTHWSIEDLGNIETAVREGLPPNLRQGTQVYLTGTTASVRDLANVMQHDRQRIELLVLGSVLVILIVLLRRFVVSVYLLLSVLFSYYATLGVAFAVFYLLDPAGFNGIDWKVAIFLFTILIAVGEDYNIFLLARVHEEEGAHGRVGGITHALTRTGPIISSCGIIMAGTFASLFAGKLTEMKQLAFALSFGVLLDTFVVRPVLVPAFLLLLAGGRVPLLPRKRGQGGAAPLRMNVGRVTARDRESQKRE